MKLKCFFSYILFICYSFVFAQEQYKQHIVSKGETISEIATKYHLNAEDIYALNPDAINGIKLKSILLIPSKSKKNKTNSKYELSNSASVRTHEVLSKETVYGISKEYNISIQDLYKANPNLETEGLKIGQIIKLQKSETHSTIKKNQDLEIKTKNTLVSDSKIIQTEPSLKDKNVGIIEVPSQGIQYVVLANESLFSIAKKHDVSLIDIKKSNPDLVNKPLKVGQIVNIVPKSGQNLILPNNKVTEVSDSKDGLKQLEDIDLKKDNLVLEKIEKRQEVVVSDARIKEVNAPIIHEVLPGESLYSISKKYGIFLVDLQKANPDLVNEFLRVGQNITIPLKNQTDSNSFQTKGNLKTENKNINENKDLKSTKTEVVLQEVFENKTQQNDYTHEVLVKETKFGIAKKYGLTVNELEKQNPIITNKLIVGTVLKIRSNLKIESQKPENQTHIESQIVEESFEKNSILPHDADLVDKLISKASENIGTRYRFGGITTNGFDCSGLMSYTFGSYNVKLPRTSIEMSSFGSIVDSENAQKGDLIFFRTGGSSRINHVGMVVEVNKNEIKFIHSSTSIGVTISSTKEFYYQKSFVQVNRVL